MLKTFFILWMVYGGGYTKGDSLMRFDTMEECVATKEAILLHSSEWWRSPTEDNILCFPVNYKSPS